MVLFLVFLSLPMLYFILTLPLVIKLSWRVEAVLRAGGLSGVGVRENRSFQRDSKKPPKEEQKSLKGGQKKRKRNYGLGMLRTLRNFEGKAKTRSKERQGLARVGYTGMVYGLRGLRRGVLFFIFLFRWLFRLGTLVVWLLHVVISFLSLLLSFYGVILGVAFGSVVLVVLLLENSGNLGVGGDGNVSNNISNQSKELATWIDVVSSVKKQGAKKKLTYYADVSAKEKETKGFTKVEYDGRVTYMRVDCSGYVAACLYLWGIEASSNAIRGATVSQSFVPTGNWASKLEGAGFERLPWESWDKCKVGDIIVKGVDGQKLCRHAHMEVYAGESSKGLPLVWNYGKTAAIQETGPTGDYKDVRYHYIWRLKY